jgi:four helix bundle protein
MTNNIKYDLEERTARFGESVILFCKSVDKSNINNPLINQLVRSGTSVGANYMEANSASSKKDFRNKIYICKKECQETKHWLRMMVVSLPERKSEIENMQQEAQSLTLIFGKIVSTIDGKSKCL